MMRCQRVKELLSQFEKGELSPALAKELEEHMSSCPECKRVVEDFTLLSRLSKEDEAHDAGEDRLARVLSSIKERLREEEKSHFAGEKEVLTLEEAAAFLRVSSDEITLELDSLPVFRIGNRLRIRRNRLLQWIEEREKSCFRKRVLSSLEVKNEG